MVSADCICAGLFREREAAAGAAAEFEVENGTGMSSRERTQRTHRAPARDVLLVILAGIVGVGIFCLVLAMADGAEIANRTEPVRPQSQIANRLSAAAAARTNEANATTYHARLVWDGLNEPWFRD